MNTYVHVWNKIQEFSGRGVPALSTNHSQHIDLVKQGRYTYFCDMTTAELEVALNCDLKIMKQRFAPFIYGVGTQNNSVYKNLFSKQ